MLDLFIRNLNFLFKPFNVAEIFQINHFGNVREIYGHQKITYKYLLPNSHGKTNKLSQTVDKTITIFFFFDKYYDFATHTITFILYITLSQNHDATLSSNSYTINNIYFYFFIFYILHKHIIYMFRSYMEDYNILPILIS